MRWKWWGQPVEQCSACAGLLSSAMLMHAPRLCLLACWCPSVVQSAARTQEPRRHRVDHDRCYASAPRRKRRVFFFFEAIGSVMTSRNDHDALTACSSGALQRAARRPGRQHARPVSESDSRRLFLSVRPSRTPVVPCKKKKKKEVLGWAAILT